MKKAVLFFCVLVSFHLYSENRVALVIGISNYDSKPLRNALNDADDMSSTLKGLGFEVILLKDSSRRDILRGIRDFGDRLDKNSVGLFYYAGHGVQINSVNYLVPVNADIVVESDIEFEGVPLDRIIQSMEDARAYQSLIFLDACRDNPYSSTSRSGSRGLTVVSADTGKNSAGSLIAFATSPGAVAEDGDGKNGTFTSALLKYIKEPGLEINQVMTKVRADVMKSTNGNQKPWTNVSLTEDFYFAGEGNRVYRGSGALELSVYDAADIYIDGEYLDSIDKDSQLTLMNIEGGDHIIEFRYPDYTEKQLINVKASEITAFGSTYEKNPMFTLETSVRGIDNVNVYLNDKLIGQTPLSQKLPVENYNVVFKHPALQDINITIEPESREIINLNIDDFTFVKHNLMFKGLPKDTEVSINSEFNNEIFTTSENNFYKIPDKLIAGKQYIKFSHPYIEDLLIDINLNDDTTISPDITKLGVLEIKNSNSDEIIIKLQHINSSKTINESIKGDITKSIKIPSGDYKVSYFKFDDSVPGIEKELIIDFNNITNERIRNFEYSVQYQLNQKLAYRRKLVNILDRKEKSRKNQQILGWSLITSGLGSLAYGFYGYSVKDSVYSDYQNAVTTSDAATYRNQLENFEITIPLTLIGGGVVAVAGLIRNLTLPDTSGDKNELNNIDMDIISLESKLEK